jgi:radical SAM enzyme (TIGR01210 family)
MKVSNTQANHPNDLIDKIKSLRHQALKKIRPYSKEQLEKPVSFWIKEDRLLHEIGKEFTIILRTKGCNWALGTSGGCSMCGYIQDANIEKVEPEQIVNQVDYAINSKLDEIRNDTNNYILKIFNSGSFFDENEIAQDVRTSIYQKIADIKKIKEVVIESRCEHINPQKLEEMKNILRDKYIEIGIGLETVDDYIRLNYINKGMVFNQFNDALQLCKEYNIGVKAYLLFKPPFLNEISAIDDCKRSIRALIDLNVNTISINPLNIQRGTLVEFLWHQNRYRPPWFYSLIKCLRKSLMEEDFKKVRILSSPSGAGTKRGIHNCLKRECNETMNKMLKEFVFHQNLKFLSPQKEEYECDCKVKYQIQRFQS